MSDVGIWKANVVKWKDFVGGQIWWRNKPQMADGRHLGFQFSAILSASINIFEPNLVQWWKISSPRGPSAQKSDFRKSEVGERGSRGIPLNLTTAYSKYRTEKESETRIVDKYVDDPVLFAADFDELTNWRQTRQVNDDVVNVVISGLPSDVCADSLSLVGATTT